MNQESPRAKVNPMVRAFALVGKIPGALMIVPLFLGAVVNTFFPQVLDIGGFTTGLFRDGTAALLGLFFVCLGAQLRVNTTGATLEKGLAIMSGKLAAGVAVGLLVAFALPDGTLFGLVPLAIIAAMTNSNTALYVSLTKQFGNTTDRGAASVIVLNDGPFFTMIALGVSGLAFFPADILIATVVPLAIGFLLGNISESAREFLKPGELLLIPFLGFVVGRGIDLSTLGSAGLAGVLLGLMTVVLSGGAAMLFMWLVHIAHRRPPRARNLIGGASEATTAGNAVATPAAVAIADPTYRAVEALATAQVAAATITTAILVPFFVAWVSRWQKRRGVSVEAEEDRAYTPA